MKKLKNQILKLAKEEDYKELEILLTSNVKESLLIIKANCEIKDGRFILRHVLTSLTSNTQGSSSLKLQIYEEVLVILRNQDGDERGDGELIAILMMCADSLTTKQLLKLIDFYISFIQSGAAFEGRWTELVGKLLALSRKREDVVYKGKEMNGEEFVYQVLKTFCGHEWTSETAVTLLSLLKDLNLPSSKLEDTITHVRETLRLVDFHSVPAIIYNLILLGGDYLAKESLTLVLDYFNEAEADKQKQENNNDDMTETELRYTNFEELIDAQGTVALHITHLSQYNPNLLREYLKTLKDSVWLPEKLITPSNLVFLLSLSSIGRYKNQIIESLKSCILKSFQYQENEDKSLWLRDTFNIKFQVVNIFKKTVENCKSGWLQVLEGLICLCFSLLESGGGVGVGPKAGIDPNHQLMLLVSKVIPLTLKKEPFLTPLVLKQLSSFIYTSSHPIHYIDILGQLTLSLPLLLLDHLNLIQDFLENLAFLNIKVATALLHVLLPLLKMSMTLKDALMLTLRKMLYLREVESRQIAVEGFLLFLLHFKVMGTLPSSQASTSFSSSMSQASVDVHSGFDLSSNEVFCLELISILKRCLTQQHQVKSHLYGSLFDVIQSNPKLAVNVLLMLHQHLLNFVDLRNGILNPILLPKTASSHGETVTQVEPLGELLSCVALCKAAFENHRAEYLETDEEYEEEIKSVLSSLCNTFDVLTERLSHADLEDIGIKKETLSSANVAGKECMFHCLTMIGVLDALIEYTFSNGAVLKVDRMKSLIAVFKTQRKVVEALCSKNVKITKKGEVAAKGKKRAPSVKLNGQVESNLNLKTVSGLLNLWLKEDPDCNNECRQLIVDNYDLQNYLLTAVDQSIEGLKTATPFQRKRTMPYYKTIGVLLLDECCRNIANHDPDDTRELERMRHCLSTLNDLILSFRKYFRDKLSQIMKDLSRKAPTRESTSHLYSVFKRCQEMLKKILFLEDNALFMKDAVIVLQIMKELTFSMERNSQEMKKSQEWLHQLIKDHSPGNILVCEALIRLLLSLSDQTFTTNVIIRGIARDIHSNLGDIEQSVTLEKENKYKIVTDESAAPILASLLSYMGSYLSVTDIGLHKLRAIQLARSRENGDIEKQFSIRYVVIIHALNELALSALPQGTIIDSTMVVITKLYVSLSLFVQYYKELFQQKNIDRMPEEFEKMVHLSCTLIKSQTLKLINYQHDIQVPDKKKKRQFAIRVQKESKLVPPLIYNMEKYETLLLGLSKMFHVNLLVNVKLSTNRDFRIKTGNLEAPPEEKEEEEGEGEEDADTVAERSEEENSPSDPPSKRRK